MASPAKSSSLDTVASPRKTSGAVFGSLPRDHAVAGLVAGMTASALFHPFDLIKTRLQVQNSPQGSRHALTALIRHEGPAALYKGLAPNFVGNAMAWGGFFLCYTAIKEQLKIYKTSSSNWNLPSPSSSSPSSSSSSSPSFSSSSSSSPPHPGSRQNGIRNSSDSSRNNTSSSDSDGDRSDSNDSSSRSSDSSSSDSNSSDVQLGPLEHIFASTVAGSAVLLMTNPIWVIKTRALLDQPPAKGESSVTVRRYKGLFAEFGHLWRTEGLAGVYRGVLPGLCGTSHGALQFMAYEEIKRRRFEQLGINEGESGARLGSVDYLLCAATSKVWATAVTYPYQVVRSRLQDQRSTYAGSWDCIRTTVRQHGPRGLYRGLFVNIVKVLPNACFVFWVYEESKILLAKWADERDKQAVDPDAQ